VTDRRPSSFRRRLAVVAGLALAVTAAVAFSRVGLLDLPSVPGGVTLESSGLAHLDTLRQLDDYLRGRTPTLDPRVLAAAFPGEPPEDARLAAESFLRALETTRGSSAADGMAQLEHVLLRHSRSLVLGNAFRMIVFDLRRTHLADARAAGSLARSFPAHLDGQPIALLSRLAAEHPSREARLNLALAWVDEMLLFPALEIKAPASVEAVKILTGLLEQDPTYVPALVARGLNHLHRPARLVWPEAKATPPDAAARDIGTAVAIGRRLDLGSDRLQATLAVALGDAYVKAGRLGVARSWWQIAQNLCHDDDVQAAVGRRYAWHDEEALDELEAELDRARAHLERPMTDLAFMWNGS